MNALSWITKEAKRLKRKYPKRFEKWTEYVAQASAIYASKHKGKSPVGHKHKKVSGMATKKRKSKRRTAAIRRARKYHAAEGRALRSIGSISRQKRALKKSLEAEIAWGLFSKDRATTKRAKKKIGKRITAKRRLLNML